MTGCGPRCPRCPAGPSRADGRDRRRVRLRRPGGRLAVRAAGPPDRLRGRRARGVPAVGHRHRRARRCGSTWRRWRPTRPGSTATRPRRWPPSRRRRTRSRASGGTPGAKGRMSSPEPLRPRRLPLRGGARYEVRGRVRLRAGLPLPACRRATGSAAKPVAAGGGLRPAAGWVFAAPRPPPRGRGARAHPSKSSCPGASPLGEPRTWSVMVLARVGRQAPSEKARPEDSVNAGLGAPERLTCLTRPCGGGSDHATRRGQAAGRAGTAAGGVASPLGARADRVGGWNPRRCRPGPRGEGKVRGVHPP